MREASGVKLSAADEKALVAKLCKAKQPAKAIQKVTDRDPATVFWDLLTRGALTLNDVAANDALFRFSEDAPSAPVLAFAKAATVATAVGMSDVLPGLSMFVNDAILSAYERSWDRATFVGRIRDAVLLASGHIPDPDRERMLEELATQVLVDSRFGIGAGLEELSRDPTFARRLAARLAAGPTPKHLFDALEAFAHLSWDRIETLLGGADLRSLGFRIAELVKHRPATTADQLLSLAEKLRPRITTGKEAFGPCRVFALAREKGATAIPGLAWDPVFDLCFAALDGDSVTALAPAMPRERILALYDRSRAAATTPGRRSWAYPLLRFAFDDARVREAIDTLTSYSNADYMGAIGKRAAPLLEAALERATTNDARDYFREALAVARATLDHGE